MPGHLVLSRRLGESIKIGNNITITVVDIDRGKVRLSIHAPPEVIILRTELSERPKRSNNDSIDEQTTN